MQRLVLWFPTVGFILLLCGCANFKSQPPPPPRWALPRSGQWLIACLHDERYGVNGKLTLSRWDWDGYPNHPETRQVEIWVAILGNMPYDVARFFRLATELEDTPVVEFVPLPEGQVDRMTGINLQMRRLSEVQTKYISTIAP